MAKSEYLDKEECEDCEHHIDKKFGEECIKGMKGEPCIYNKEGE